MYQKHNKSGKEKRELYQTKNSLHSKGNKKHEKAAQQKIFTNYISDKLIYKSCNSTAK